MAAVGGLRDIAGIAFDKKETDAHDALAKDRNALQHYGLTHSAQEVEARAGRVLDFLMRFPEAEHLPLLSDPEREAAARDMIPVMGGKERQLLSQAAPGPPTRRAEGAGEHGHSVPRL
ncbi:hypothetical protein [Streptomyces sp. NPDC005731]|uniref:hypothetical protein n=1 Tax=Streptomyces sp. NPDC005731 TaxID=3157056 RepID=UPI0033F9B9FC